MREAHADKEAAAAAAALPACLPAGYAELSMLCRRVICALAAAGMQLSLLQKQ